jgi:hypothetical protein
MKQIYFNLKWVPEFYFIMVSILWFYHSVNFQHSSSINFPAVILIVLFHMQLFMNNQKFGKVLAGIVAIASMVLVLVLSQRIMNSVQFDHDSQLFTLEIGNLVIVNLIMAFLMYTRHENPENALAQ